MDILRPIARTPVAPVELAPWQKAEAQAARVAARLNVVHGMMMEATYTDSLAAASEVYASMLYEPHVMGLRSLRNEMAFLDHRARQLVVEIAKLK